MRCFVFFCFFCAFSLWSQNAKLRIEFVDSGSSSRIDNMDVKVDSVYQGTANSYGYFSCELKKGGHLLSFNHPGYLSQSKYLVIKGDTNLIVKMNVKVWVYKTMKITSTPSQNAFGRDYIHRTDFVKFPYVFSEPDPFKVLQLKPGISNVQELNSGIYARGGNIDQSMILYDEAPIYNSLHYLGLYSTFDVNAIQSISLYKNAIPAKFGGRGSTIVEVKSRDGNFNKHHQEFDLGVLQSKVLLEGPLRRQKMSYLLSTRFAYPLLLATPNLKGGLSGLSNYFYDVNAKLTHYINKQHSIYYSLFASKDKFSPNDNLPIGSLDYTNLLSNLTGTVRWNNVRSKTLFINTSFSLSNFKSRLVAEPEDILLDRSNRIGNYLLKSDVEQIRSANTKWSYGAQLLYYNGSTGNIKAYKQLTDTSTQKNTGLETSVYFSHNYKWKKSELNTGFRLSHYSAFLPQTIGFLRLEPRINYSLQVTRRKSFSVSYDKSTQYQHLISQNLVVFPTDFWANSSKQLQPQITHCFTLGHNFKSKIWEVNSAVFYKKYNNTFDYKDGADLSNFNQLQSQLLILNTLAYGFEMEQNLFLANDWTANLNYTYSKSIRRHPLINSNQWYPANFDRPHQLNISVSHPFNSKLRASALFVLQSGRPITLREYPNYYGDRNKYRLPFYHRLDIGITYCKRPLRKTFRSEWCFSVYNVYNQKNVYSVYWNFQTAGYVQLTLLPFIPSLSYKLVIK